MKFSSRASGVWGGVGDTVRIFLDASGGSSGGVGNGLLDDRGVGGDFLLSSGGGEFLLSSGGVGNRLLSGVVDGVTTLFNCL